MGLRRAYRRWRGSPAQACEPMRSASPQGHLLITGTGRAGTTLMMRIMINLGLDTGYRPEDIPAVEANIARAGLEHELRPDTADRLPAIIKTPLATDVLHDALGKGWLDLWHTFIPVRNLQDAADSRRAAQRKADALGLDRATAPGILWKTDDPLMQEPALAIQLYKAIDALALHAVPVTFLSFPRFVTDHDHFVERTLPVLSQGFSVVEADLRRALREECRPEFVAEWQT